jgi:hypothetical protein
MSPANNSVCINQDDDEEKSGQVNLMARIYLKASFTLVWLGQGADDSDLVFPLFEKVMAVEDLPVTISHEYLFALLAEKDLPE